jgi:A/G-specific adenine glycosylase
MAKTSFSAPKPAALLGWYAANGRDLPWRSYQGRAPSPYHTWLSEIMLQQTTVATVIPYYERFTTLWPTVNALAAAHEDDIMKEWSGLGYYSRARNLLKCAHMIVNDFGSKFPTEISELKSLPGIGDYTSNAIRAIAFDLPANVVDGNVERVTARVFAFNQPLNLPENKKCIHALAAQLADTKAAKENASYYAQALMDLGATICTPRNPKCSLCPWQKQCLAFKTGQTDTIPVIQRRAKLPERHTSVFVIQDKTGRYYLQKRPDKGLLAGLWEFPSTEWAPLGSDNILSAPLPLKQFIHLSKPVIHVFTHFKLTLQVFVHSTPVAASRLNGPGEWFAVEDMPALSTLTRKVLAAASPKK